MWCWSVECMTHVGFEGRMQYTCCGGKLGTKHTVGGNWGKAHEVLES